MNSKQTFTVSFHGLDRFCDEFEARIADLECRNISEYIRSAVLLDLKRGGDLEVPENDFGIPCRRFISQKSRRAQKESGGTMAELEKLMKSSPAATRGPSSEDRKKYPDHSPSGQELNDQPPKKKRK